MKRWNWSKVHPIVVYNLSNPRDRGDILLLSLSLAKLDNTSVCGVPDINTRC